MHIDKLTMAESLWLLADFKSGTLCQAKAVLKKFTLPGSEIGSLGTKHSHILNCTHTRKGLYIVWQTVRKI